MDVHRPRQKMVKLKKSKNVKDIKISKTLVRTKLVIVKRDEEWEI